MQRAPPGPVLMIVLLALAHGTASAAGTPESSGPVSVTPVASPEPALAMDAASVRVASNLALLELTATVTATSPSPSLLRIIDGSEESAWIQKVSRNGDDMLDFMLPELDGTFTSGFALHVPERAVKARSSPREVGIDVSPEESGSGYREVARRTIPDAPGWYRIDIPPVAARLVRLRILRTYGGRDVSLGEFVVLEDPSRDSVLRRRTAIRADTDSLEGRVNWLSEARGARVISNTRKTSSSVQIRGPEILLRARDADWGWVPRGPMPVEAILSMAGDALVPIETLVFRQARDPRRHIPEIADAASRVRAIRLFYSTLEDGEEFQPLGLHFLESHLEVQQLVFPRFEAHRIKVVLLGTAGGKSIHLGRIQAFAPRGEEPPGPSIDLLARASGGNLIRCTPPGSKVGALNGPEVNGPWTVLGASGTRPELVWSFRGTETARLAKLVIELPPDSAKNWPEMVEISRSPSSPFAGFVPLGSLKLGPGDPRRELTLGETEVRFLRLVFHPPAGSRGQIRVSRVLAIERAIPGRGSLVDRSPPAGAEDLDSPAAGGESEPAASPGPVGVEADDVLEGATELIPSVPQSGRLEPTSDLDHYRYSGTSGGGDELRVDQPPSLQLKVEILDPVNATPIETDTVRITGSQLQVNLGPGPRGFRLGRGPTSILMIFDTSGSMTSVRAQVQQAATRFLDALPPDIEVATSLIKKNGIELLADFTRDRDTLRTRTSEGLTRMGTSGAVLALHRGLEHLGERDTNRAIVIMSDFLEDGDPAALWDLIPRLGVRIYTVAFGIRFESQWRNLIGITQEQFMRNLAWSSGGRFLHAPDGDSLTALYQSIARDLNRTPPYRIEIVPAPAPGELRVDFAGEEVRRRIGSDRLLLLILDASGSMKYPVKGDREPKIEIARKVIHRLIDEIPEGTRIGLRVYGRRYSPRDPRTCEDRELLIPVVSLQRRKFQSIVDSIEVRGETPMIASILDSARDFPEAHAAGRTVILVSDGLETCQGKPEDIEALRRSGTDVIDVNVVGFDIEDPAAVEQLTAIARHGGGQYLHARDPGTLASALSGMTALTYDVLDREGRKVAQGIVGGPSIQLPVGSYQVVPRSLSPLPRRDVMIVTRSESRVVLE